MNDPLETASLKIKSASVPCFSFGYRCFFESVKGTSSERLTEKNDYAIISLEGGFDMKKRKKSGISPMPSYSEIVESLYGRYPSFVEGITVIDMTNKYINML